MTGDPPFCPAFILNKGGYDGSTTPSAPVPARIRFSSASLTAQVPTGKIYGTVTDEQGNPLPGVAVEATSAQLVGKAAAVTETNGVYRLFALTPGTYKITFTLAGFKPLTRDGIVVALEQTVKLDAGLELGAIEEQVTVVGKTPLIDVKTTVKGMTMTRETFQILPRGRDFDSLIAAVPGVANEPMLGGFSVDGASGLENMFYVDGTDISDTWTGARGEDVAFEFVEEVQVKASGYQAEFGGAMGGVINVITRQGGNSYHGDLLGYYSGSALYGKERDTLRYNPYDIYLAEYVNYQDLYGKDKVDRIEGGFSLGGFIIKDRLWFFGSFLPVFLNTTRHVVFTPSSRRGDYTQKYQYWNFQAKLTAQPLKFMRVGASFINNSNKYKGALPNRDGTSDPTDFWPDYGFTYPRWSASAYVDIYARQQPACELPRRLLLYQYHRPTGPAPRASILMSGRRRGLPGDPRGISETRRLVQLPFHQCGERASGRDPMLTATPAIFSTWPANTPGNSECPGLAWMTTC